MTPGRDVPRELLVPPSVRGLVRMALEEWALIAALWLAVAWTPGALYPLWLLLLAGRLHALGVIVHDAVHLPPRHRPAGVRLVELLAGFPVTTTLAAMRYHHLRHHRDSGMATDPYFKGPLEGRPVRYTLAVLQGALLPLFWTVRSYVGLVASIVPAWRNVYGRVFLQDRSGEDLTGSAEVVACGRAELGQCLFQAPVICALVAWPRPVLMGYVLPLAVAGVLSAWRLLREHSDRPAYDRSVETVLATTNDHTLGGWGQVVFAPRNVGFHLVHHLHPQVSLTALPALRRWYLMHQPGRYPR